LIYNVKKLKDVLATGMVAKKKQRVAALPEMF
jgi:hypothetical protein